MARMRASSGSSLTTYMGDTYYPDVNNIVDVPPILVASLLASGYVVIDPRDGPQGVNSIVRPTGVQAGQPVFDLTIGKPIWWTGSAWVDATGTPQSYVSGQVNFSILDNSGLI